MWNLEHDWYSPKSLLSTPTHYDFPVNYSPSLNLTFNLANFVFLYLFLFFFFSRVIASFPTGVWWILIKPRVCSQTGPKKFRTKNSMYHSSFSHTLGVCFCVCSFFFSCLRNITFESFELCPSSLIFKEFFLVSKVVNFFFRTQEKPFLLKFLNVYLLFPWLAVFYHYKVHFFLASGIFVASDFESFYILFPLLKISS